MNFLSAIKSKATALAFALFASMVPAIVSAQAATPGTFDSGSVITVIQERGATAVLIVGALILVAWGIRTMFLLRGRG